MSGATRFSMRWTRERAALLAFACFAVGVAGGWSFRALRPGGTSPLATSADAAQTAAGQDPAVPGPAQLKQMADAQAAPLVERLKSDPANPELLANLGNLYYDAKQYSTAAQYYARALESKPTNAAVRTDMGTAFWFMGDPDRAIAEFQKALADAPNSPNTLFNLGMVKWKGKKDAAGAIAAWEKLLATDPQYEQKGQVEELMAEVKRQSAATPE